MRPGAARPVSDGGAALSRKGRSAGERAARFANAVECANMGAAEAGAAPV